MVLQAEAAAAALMGDAQEQEGGWPCLARRGLHSVLVSRAGAEQRHAGLRLTAAILDLLPATWLLGPGAPLVHPLFQVSVRTGPGTHSTHSPSHLSVHTGPRAHLGHCSSRLWVHIGPGAQPGPSSCEMLTHVGP